MRQVTAGRIVGVASTVVDGTQRDRNTGRTCTVVRGAGDGVRVR
jgi:hypothetical protein